MQTRQQDLFTTVRTEGSILPPDLLQHIVDETTDIDGLSPTDYHLSGERINEAVSRSWNRLQGIWAAFRQTCEKLPTEDVGTTVVRERWLLPLFQEVGYGRLQTAKSIEIEGKAYAISHVWQHAPIHLVSFRADLDKRAAGITGASRASPHSLVQELLNREEAFLWGFVSNGFRLRVLRDNKSLTRQAFVEFDLQAMMDGQVYPDFKLLWLLCHQSRVEADRPDQCWLEKWSQAAIKQGTRALDGLRDGVQRAIEALGRGFLSHPANRALRDRLQTGTLDKQDYYRQLLRLIYRLLFLFVAEDRGLLFDPASSSKSRERYTRFYSTNRLRALAGNSRGTLHVDLFQALNLIFTKLDQTGSPELGLPALGSFLWSAQAIADVSALRLSNRDLLDAIRELAYTLDGQARRPVDYKNLGAEELGSIYESLLELHPHINADAGTFDLDTAAGHERKTTGSYYTPTSLVNCLLDSALAPVLDDAVMGGEGYKDRGDTAEKRILSLKVCDAACGSGHFLIAAAHRIAKRLAAVCTGDEEPSPTAYRHALRDVIGHCIYGVDINPMAVELCKVSLWMEALEPGRPLSFLDHRIQVGNSLIGATPALMVRGIPDEAFAPVEGDDKSVCRALKRSNQDERKGQLSLFGTSSSPNTLLELAEGMSAINEAADATIADIRDKKIKYHSLIQGSQYQHQSLLADAWCSAFVCPKLQGTAAITEETFRRLRAAPEAINDEQRRMIEVAAQQHLFFHWHLRFPDVFDLSEDSLSDSETGWGGGFDAILGNPPFVNAIEGGITNNTKKIARLLHGKVTGTADLAYYFFDQSVLLLRHGGRIGLIQPRAVLNAPSMGEVREHLPAGLKPLLIYAPDRHDLFFGAAVYVCILVLGNGESCRVSKDPDDAAPAWHIGQISSANWWAAIEDIIARRPPRSEAKGLRLDDSFSVQASMTTADAYDAAPFISDDAEGGSLKLITTGLIDPRKCLWGEVICRFLKKDYQHPRFHERDGLTKSLQKRLAQSRRPKLLVAGLTKRVECFVDHAGEYIGTVATFSIYHPTDDLSALDKLSEFLLSDDVSRDFVSELGGGGMRGAHITMKRGFLEELRLPMNETLTAKGSQDADAI